MTEQPTAHVVVGNGFYIDAAGVHTGPPATGAFGVTELAAIAAAWNCGSVWLMPGCALDQAAQSPAFWRQPAGWRVFAPAAPGMAPTFGIVRADRRDRWTPELQVFADLQQWGISPDATPQTVYTAIQGYLRAMQVPVAYSPAATSLALLERSCSTPQRAGWLRAMDARIVRDLPWPTVTAPNHCTCSTLDAPYLHIFDKNSAYLAMCTESYGSGTPDHVDGGKYSKNLYGLWRVTAEPLDSLWDGLYLPNPFGSSQEIFSEWYYTPQVELAMQLGWQVTIHEGYVWPESHELLKDWARRLHDCRAMSRERWPVLDRMLKVTATRTWGRLEHKPLPDEPVKWSHRPDWTGTIKARAYQRALLQIRKIERATVTTPTFYVAVDTDALVFASDLADPAEACPGMLDRQDQLGGYKHVRTLSGPIVAQLLGDAPSCGSGSAFMALVRKYRREMGQ